MLKQFSTWSTGLVGREGGLDRGNADNEEDGEVVGDGERENIRGILICALDGIRLGLREGVGVGVGLGRMMVRVTTTSSLS